MVYENNMEHWWHLCFEHVKHCIARLLNVRFKCDLTIDRFSFQEGKRKKKKKKVHEAVTK
jgi:hypothetical protein